jgi:ribosomal-protein-serine acetyltransferase
MARPSLSPEIIVSENVILKLLTQESAGVIFEATNSNRQSLRRWLPFVDNTWKGEDTENFIKCILRDSGPKYDVVYEIWYLNSFAGLIAIKEVDEWNKRAELGYWLVPRFEGKGIMVSCCTAVLYFAFSNLGLNRVQIKVGIGNARSSRIPERLGFKFEGIERAGEKFPDHYNDLEVYSMLKKEWSF